MPTFTVIIEATLSYSIVVEAEDSDEAADKAFESPEMPGGLLSGAFASETSSHVPVDCGEWHAAEVHDADGKAVWIEELSG
jgi:hypothetical protein